MELNSGLSCDVFHPSLGVFHYRNISFHNQIMIQNEIRIDQKDKNYSVNHQSSKNKNLNRGYDFTTARLKGRLDTIHAVCDNILFARIIDEFRNVK